MKIARRFTKSGQDVFSTVEYEKRTSRITNPDGSVVFEMNDAEIPRNWSQLATDIMVSKYFRKAGILTDPQVQKSLPSKSFIVWPVAGGTGARRTATSTRPTMPRPSTMSSRTCCCTRCAPRTARSGSTPG